MSAAGQNEFKCNACKRSFKTAASLAQHKKDMHGGAAAAARSRPAKNRRRASGPNRVTGAGAPVSASTRVSNVQSSDYSLLTGVDRIHHISNISSLHHGDVVFDYLLEPAMMRRFSQVAQTYQRVRYLALKFRVETYVPTSTGGGYVVAFVRDPDDQTGGMEAEEGLSWLTAQRGSVSTKWWQSSTIQVPIPNRLYYTSRGVEIREYSPGRIVMMVDGASTQDGSVTVYCEWRVRLEGDSLEAPRQSSKDFTSAVDLWIQDGHQGLWFKDKDGKFQSTAKGMFHPDLKKKSTYRLQIPIYWQNGPDLRVAYWIFVQDDNTVLPCKDAPNNPWVDPFNNTDMVIPVGTEVYEYKLKALNEQRDSSQQQVMSPGSGSSGISGPGCQTLEKALQRRMSSLELSVQTLSESFGKSHALLEKLDSMVRQLSTGSPLELIHSSDL